MLHRFWTQGRLPAPTTTLVLAVLAGAAGAATLVDRRLGIGAAALGVLLWAPAVPTLLGRRAWRDLAMAGLTVGLVAMVAVRDAGWVLALCLTVATWTGAVAATSARSAPAVLASAATAALGGLRASAWAVRGAGALVGTRRGRLLTGLRSVGVTAVLLLVFGWLFVSADRVFASYLPTVEVASLPAQVVVGTLVALGAATVAHLVLVTPEWSDVRLPAGRPAGRAEWLLPVLALGALVVAFVLVQLGALIGGHRYVLETTGVTYAQYAREGFGQLVVATALTLLVIAVAARRAPTATAADRLVARAALGVLCVGTLGVVASALRRMDLYMEAFGWTRLRVFVVLVEVVLGAVLVLVLVAGAVRRYGWLPTAAVHVVGVAAIALAVANPDAMIVRHNVSADLENGLDVSYLAGLSADAVPAMAELDEPLRSCLLAQVDVGAHSGVEWNLARQEAAEALVTWDPVVGDVARRGDGTKAPCSSSGR